MTLPDAQTAPPCPPPHPADPKAAAELIAGNVRAERARITPVPEVCALAARLGLSDSTVRSRLSGATPWTGGELVVLADAMAVPVTALLPRPPVHVRSWWDYLTGGQS